MTVTRISGKLIDAPTRRVVQSQLGEQNSARDWVIRNLDTWKAIVAPDDRAPRHQETRDVTNQAVRQVAEAAAKLGIP